MFGYSRKVQDLVKPWVIVVVVLVFGVACAPASAFEGYVPVEPEFGSFSDATGIAVDQANGNVYVVDSEANDVQVFGAEGGTPAGGGPSSFTGTSNPSEGFAFKREPAGPAASNGVVYIPDVGHNVVDKFALNGAHEYEYLCEFAGTGGFIGTACLPNGGSPNNALGVEPLGTAIDSAGDVYISDWGSSNIYEFNAAGEEVGVFSSEVLERPEYITVAANGTIYAEKYKGGPGPLVKFTRSSPTGPVEGEPVRIAEQVSGLAYDNAKNTLFVDVGSAVQELDSEGKVLSTFGVGVVNGGRGLAVDEATGDVYVVSNNAVQRFKHALVAAAKTQPAKNVTYRTAELCGTVNPESNTLAASYQFQYGETTGYGQVAPASPVSVGTGETIQEVCAPVEGLNAGSTYHYRIVTSNSEASNPGSDETFTTLLAVQGLTTLPASNVQPASVTLNGSFEANGQDTKCEFQYGESESYGETTTLEDRGTQPSGTTTFEQAIGGLQPEHVYHYRVLCENAFGQTAGADETVQTAPAVAALATLPASNVQPTSATLNGSFEATGQDTFCIFQYGQSEGYGQFTGLEDEGTQASGTTTVEQSASGMQQGTLYHYRILCINSFGLTFGPDHTVSLPWTPPLPSGLPAAFQVARTSAKLSGTLDPQGSVTHYYYQYGETEAYGQSSAVASLPAEEANMTAGPVEIGGLKHATLYHYRLVAENLGGTVYGPDGTFETLAATPPVVSTGVASNITQTSASVAATVDPEGLPTSYEIQLGTDTAYQGPAISGNAGNNQASEPVSVSLVLLAPGTTYHYRIVATNQDGTSDGEDKTFTTPGLSAPLLQPPASVLIPTTPYAFAPEPGPTSKTPAGKTTKKKTKTKKKTRKHKKAKHKKKK